MVSSVREVVCKTRGKRCCWRAKRKKIDRDKNSWIKLIVSVLLCYCWCCNNSNDNNNNDNNKLAITVIIVTFYYY